MSAIIAVLVVLAAAVVAGLSAQVNQGSSNYAAEQLSKVAQSDEVAPDDKPEPKPHKQADKRSVKRDEKQKACVRDCPVPWPHYELRAWPL
jgi:hypothetical protein